MSWNNTKIGHKIKRWVFFLQYYGNEIFKICKRENNRILFFFAKPFSYCIFIPNILIHYQYPLRLSGVIALIGAM